MTQQETDTNDFQKQIDTVKKDISKIRTKYEKPIALRDIPQGPSSRLDSDTVDGLHAFTSAQPAPNALVGLDNTGKFPVSTIPITFSASLVHYSWRTWQGF